MEAAQNTLVFRPKEYAFIQSFLTDKPLSDQPEIAHPSFVEISDMVKGSIDDAMVKKALDENKPEFSIWNLSRMPLKYKIIEAIRRGEYALAETYSYDRKKALKAWPVTILAGALILRALIPINPVAERTFFKEQDYNLPNVGYFYEKMANKWFKFPVFVYTPKTNGVNSVLFFRLFGEDIDSPLYGLYRQQKFQLRFGEPQSNKIKRVRKENTEIVVKKLVSPSFKNYRNNIESILKQY